jgi:septal ring factor EnvC (AmiA/AmiB activator)
MSEATSANEEFPPQPAAQRRGRGWPIVAAIAVGALLVGLVIGFLINQPRVSDAQDEADQANAELASVSEELADTQAQVSDAQAALAACQPLVDSTTEFADGWDQLNELQAAFEATPLGSAEEAEALAQLDSRYTSLTTVVGTVRAHLATCNPTSTGSVLFFPTTP